MTVDEVLGEVERIYREHGVRELFLFSSYAMGCATKTSDIDIVVKGVTNLAELQEKLAWIPTLKKIDVFDYDACKNPELIKAMDRYGKRIY